MAPNVGHLGEQSIGRRSRPCIGLTYLLEPPPVDPMAFMSRRLSSSSENGGSERPAQRAGRSTAQTGLRTAGSTAPSCPGSATSGGCCRASETFKIGPRTTSRCSRDRCHSFTSTACGSLRGSRSMLGVVGASLKFDRFPFGLLTLVVSREAIFLSTFILISQNRQAERSEVRSQIDFENNLRAEIWSVHVGQASGIDPEHVEDVISQTIAGYASEGHLAKSEPT